MGIDSAPENTTTSNQNGQNFMQRRPQFQN
jgi:hypothetical protein